MLEQRAISILNDVLPFHQVGMTASDWTAIMALLFSIVTLWWQNRIRNKDEKRQREEKKYDEIMRKWSAEYPYKIKLFTDFYDLLFRFVNYRGSARKISRGSVGDKILTQIHLDDLSRFWSQMNEIDEECKVLFPGKIEQRVHEAYELMAEFFNTALVGDKGNMFDFAASIENNKDSVIYCELQQKLEKVQIAIKDLKLEFGLREMFKRELKAPGGKDE